jgi:NTP pyrophosphatase (non-canonical NTP hydrolase)
MSTPTAALASRQEGAAMTNAMTMRTAARIVHHLRANGFTARDAAQRQVLNLMEEAGEFIGAYRRWTGLARRPGTVQDVHAELADVLITAYVTAAELGLTIDPPPPVRPADPLHAVVGVFAAVYQAVRLFPEAPIDRLALGSVVSAAEQAAAALAFDLDDAVAAKLDVIFSRGWREPAVSGVDAPHTVLCGLGCGYLAHGEADLDDHEAHCDHADQWCPDVWPATDATRAIPASLDNGRRGQATPTPRPVPSRHHARNGNGR